MTRPRPDTPEDKVARLVVVAAFASQLAREVLHLSPDATTPLIRAYAGVIRDEFGSLTGTVPAVLTPAEGEGSVPCEGNVPCEEAPH